MKTYNIVKEKGNDNFTHSIYSDDADGEGLLIARCNQNGRYPWQAKAIVQGLQDYKIGKKTNA